MSFSVTDVTKEMAQLEHLFPVVIQPAVEENRVGQLLLSAHPNGGTTMHYYASKWICAE